MIDDIKAEILPALFTGPGKRVKAIEKLIDRAFLEGRRAEFRIVDKRAAEGKRDNRQWRKSRRRVLDIKIVES